MALAKRHNAKAVAVVFDVPKDFCFHLNTYRSLDTHSDQHRKEKVPDMVIHSYYKNFEAPTADEGFDAVITLGVEHFNPAGNVDTAKLRLFLR